MKIYIACLKNLVTGGIELLHQLCHELNTYADIDAYIWFEDEKDAIIPEPYRKYGNIVAINSRPSKDTVLIFPEVWASKTNSEKYKDHQKVIYWESVYWYEYWIPKSQYLKFPDGVIHIAQSYYACEWLKRETNIDAIMVTDYLNDEYMNADLGKPRKRQILYNPKKGLDITTRLITQMPNEKFIPILDMTVSQVKTLMEESMLYIDFGNHPGKDRIPREAAMCGCCVITSTDGSAKYCQDVCIPSDYKIDKADRLFEQKAIAKIEDCLDNYMLIVGQDFKTYRNNIKLEKKNFKIGVLELVDRLLGVTE